MRQNPLSGTWSKRVTVVSRREATSLRGALGTEFSIFKLLKNKALS